MIESPLPNWPYSLFDLQATKIVAAKDNISMRQYLQVTRGLDRLDFLIASPATGDNIYFEFSPDVDSVLYEFKAHAKSAGVGDLTARVRVNGTAVDTITIAGGSTAVVAKTPNPQLNVTRFDKISLDLTAVGGAWADLTVTVILEPRITE